MSTKTPSTETNDVTRLSWGLGAYLLGVTLLAMYLLIKCWPGSSDQEQSVIAMVLLSGALGSQIHALTSFASHIGLKQFDSAWLWWFVFRPVSGALLALVFYFSVRGGLLLLVEGDATEIRVSGIAAISMLVGLFTEQATHKLKELFDTLFAVKNEPKHDAENQQTSAADVDTPTLLVNGLDPKQIKQGSPDSKVAILGENLTSDLSVKLADSIYPVALDEQGNAHVTLPEAALQTEGKQVLVVMSKDKQPVAELELDIVAE